MPSAMVTLRRMCGVSEIGLRDRLAFGKERFPARILSSPLAQGEFPCGNFQVRMFAGGMAVAEARSCCVEV